MNAFSRKTAPLLALMLFPLLAATAPAGATSPLLGRALPQIATPAPTGQPARPVLETVAQNTGAAAQATVEKMGKTAMDAIGDAAMTDDRKRAIFRQILSQNFDMNRVARFAAGKYWRQATPAQQQEYLRLYQEMVIKVYTARFKNYAGQTFNVTGNRMDESGDAIVTSQVTGKGSPIAVDWRIRPEGGAYKVIDVMVEGVSMAVTQRNDFAGVIQRGGGTFDALTAYLKQGGTSDVKD